jgi:ATP-dependent protease ClpP protease subunit
MKRLWSVLKRTLLYMGVITLGILTASIIATYHNPKGVEDNQAQVSRVADDPEPAPTPDPIPTDEVPVIPTRLKKPPHWEHFVPEIVVRGGFTKPLADFVEVLVKTINASRHDENQDGVEAVVLVIDSEGGDTEAGIRVVEALQSLEVPLICVADQRAFSMAYFMMQVCTLRLGTERSAFMVHEVRMGDADTFQASTRQELLNKAEYLRVLSDGWLRMCAKRMGCSFESLRDHVRNYNWWMNSHEALQAGAIDGIVDNITVDVLTPLETEGRIPRFGALDSLGSEQQELESDSPRKSPPVRRPRLPAPRPRHP